MAGSLNEQQITLGSLRREQQPTYRIGLMNSLYKVQKGKKVVYYVPTYMRLKVKNIVGMDLFTLSGEVNCTFILSLYYSTMQQQAAQFLSKSIQIAFHKTNAIILDQQNMQVDRKNDKNKKLITLTLRKSISSKLQGQIFWSPFQTVKFIMSLTLRSLKTKIGPKSYVFKFNLMDCEENDLKFSLAEEWNFGIYKIANAQLFVQYTNQFGYSGSTSNQIRKSRNTLGSQSGTSTSIPDSKKKIGDQDQQEPLAMRTTVRNFQYGHFILPAYKKPNPTLLTIYFPLLLLGIINIGIFFQDYSRTGKIMINISALLISFIALIPTVRQNTAVSPTVTFTQLMVFLQSFTTILTMFKMILYRDVQGYVQDGPNDGFLISSIIITVFVALCILTLSLLHKFYWLKQYHRPCSKKPLKFDHKKWYNKACDKYFYEQILDIQRYEEVVQEKQDKKLVKRVLDQQGYGTFTDDLRRNIFGGGQQGTSKVLMVQTSNQNLRYNKDQNL